MSLALDGVKGLELTDFSCFVFGLSIAIEGQQDVVGLVSTAWDWEQTRALGHHLVDVKLAPLLSRFEKVCT